MSKANSNKKVTSSFQRLMITFTIILVTIICITTSVFVVISIKNYRLEQKTIENMAITKVSDNLQNQITVTKNIANYVSESQQRIDNIHSFLHDSPAKYSQKILDDSYQNNNYFNWPKANEDFYINYPGLRKVAVQFEDEDKASLSTMYDTNGRVVPLKEAFNQQMIYGNIISPQQERSVGLVGTEFDECGLNTDLSRISKSHHLQVVVMSNDGRVLYHFADKSVAPDERKRVNAILNGKRDTYLKNYSVKQSKFDQDYVIYTLFNNDISKKLMLWRMMPIAIGGLIVLGLLIIAFTITFTRYRHQLMEIVKTIKLVGNNNFNARIKTDKDNYDDLVTLSQSINKMLDDINNYINTIYRMRIAQQDAQMKALQAQISPHFMANTLEYIRMACITNGDRDLAKVVYSFAALLRENVGNNIQTNLKQEAKLVKNYIYLYQVRFPDKLAFQVNIDPALYQVKIPKFTLQPIVENYFKHGVDFANSYNAIEIKGRLIGGRVNLWVIDNGKNLSLEELSKLNLKLQEPITGNHSVGLPNVYARMNNYTKHFKMMITNNDYGGITVKLSFDYEG